MLLSNLMSYSQKTEYSDASIGDVKVGNVIGGMRGLRAMLWDSSVLDPEEGIRFHGLSIPDCQKALPAALNGKEIIAESMLWLLLTGQVPSVEQTRQLSRELAQKGNLPSAVENLIDSCVASEMLIWPFSDVFLDCQGHCTP
jgi:citrate synthase